MKETMELRIWSPKGCTVQLYEEVEEGSKIFYLKSETPLGVQTQVVTAITGESIPTHPKPSIPPLPPQPVDPRSLTEIQGGIQVGKMQDNLPPTPGG